MTTATITVSSKVSFDKIQFLLGPPAILSKPIYTCGDDSSRQCFKAYLQVTIEIHLLF